MLDLLPTASLRRRPAWSRAALAAAVVLGITAGVAVALAIAVWMGFTGARAGSVSVLVPAAFALAVVGLAAAMDMAVQVRRLRSELADERAAAANLARRVELQQTLDQATAPLALEFDPETLLREIVTHAADLVDAESGALFVLETPDVVRVAATVGTGYVCNSRRPLADGPLAHSLDLRQARSETLPDATVVRRVPLLHRGAALGVLELRGGRAALPTDLHALALFAEPAAEAMARVRIVETERQHVDELLELDRMKRAYVSGIGHDLRTPLTALRAATRALPRTGDRQAQVQLLEVIDRQVDRLAALAQALVDADNATIPDVQLLDLPALVRLIALDAELAGRPVVVDAPERLDVLADAEAVRRIVANLIDNAFTHGAPPVTITVGARNGRAVLSITDQGPGIDSGEQDRIFEHAYRGARGAHPGRGLGLAIVRSLAEACGGTAWYDAAPKGGARFSVSLRMRDVSQQEAAWMHGQVC